MPLSTSFPSGHSASAAAFAVSVGRLLPGLRLPLRVAAGIVAFSRLYTGVHYPSDVVVGAALGTIVGWATSTVALRLRAYPCGAAPRQRRIAGNLTPDEVQGPIQA
jgi:undecaprenyl-diphosphatase